MTTFRHRPNSGVHDVIAQSLDTASKFTSESASSTNERSSMERPSYDRKVLVERRRASASLMKGPSGSSDTLPDFKTAIQSSREPRKCSINHFIPGMGPLRNSASASFSRSSL